MYAPVVRALIAPAWAAWESSPYLRDYRRLKRTQYDTSERIAERQWQAVSDLVRHACDTVPYWRRRLRKAGVEPAALHGFDDFARVPLLTKKDLRDHAGELVSTKFDRGRLTSNRTSGSTGVSVEVLADDATMQWRRACTLRSDEWSGWRFGERKAMVWGNPEYLKRGWRGLLRNRLLERETFLDTLRMDDEAIDRFLDALRRRPPTLVFGHAHSVYLLARHAERRGGLGFAPVGTITTAMVLHDWERACIESVFGCRVTNRYGCEEVGLIACECEEHEGLHVNADGVYLEILRPDGSRAAPGETGAIVVTDLMNRAMPLLRYQVGDMGSLSDRHCRCGRGLPLLERIEGRVADYVVTPSGQLVSGISLTENFAMLVPGIEQIQIVQESVDRLVFRIVPAGDFDQTSESRIAELVASRFGADCSYVCEYVTQIEREPSGKYRFCISKVPNPYSLLNSLQRSQAAEAIADEGAAS